MSYVYKPTKAGRRQQLERVGCIACREEGFPRQPFELIPLRNGGDSPDWERSVPLCRWHSLGIETRMQGFNRDVLGPSLKREPEAFRARYGSAAVLLEKTDSARLQER
jgi:hypothetical protein